MADFNQANARKKTGLSEYNLRLVADPINGARRGPNMGFVVVKNNPHIEVRTNIENDKDYGRIIAKLDSPTFYAIIEAINEAPTWPNDKKVMWSINAHRFVNRQRSKDPMLDAKVLVGKDKEGVVYMSVLSWDKERPLIKFPFRPAALHSVAHGDGTPLTAAEISVLYCRSWVRMLNNLVAHLLITEYVEPPPPQQQQGGGGGFSGGQGGSNGGGGYGNRGSFQGGGGSSAGGSATGGGGGTDDEFPF
jgi:uncharacterized membrane protein YgcG